MKKDHELLYTYLVKERVMSRARCNCGEWALEWEGPTQGQLLKTVVDAKYQEHVNDD